MSLPLLAAVSLGFVPQAAQDDKILERADKLLEEAKAAYELGREKSSVESFIDAGFKLEEARIKYFVLQEIGSAEKQKIAVDRLRAINQLAKLIHDGKVAVSGKAAEPPEAKPAELAKPGPAAEPKPAAPPAPPVDVTRRLPVPDAAKQKDAEKLVKELFKDQYAKKSQADRQSLARALLDQAKASKDDPVSLWVLYREAQEVAVQSCDVRTAVAAIEEASKAFDVDPLAMKNAALAAAGKVAKTPEEVSDVIEALDPLIEELMAMDLYDTADKAATAALQQARRVNDPKLLGRVTLRAKEVGEAKTRFLGVKSALQTFAKNPDDPGANLEMGQFLCFVKANWDLGLRFLVKGSDASLKSIAEKELGLAANPADQGAVADLWYDLAEKEKVPYRKSQLLMHARTLYEAAQPSAVGLVRTRIERRLELIQKTVGAVPERAAINLFKLIDLKKDSVSGSWYTKGSSITCQNQEFSRLQIPYLVPTEYDLSVTLERVSDDFLYFGLVSDQVRFAAVIDPSFKAWFECIEGKGASAQDPSWTYPNPPVPAGKPVTIKAIVRKSAVKIVIDGKVILNWEGGMNRLSPNGQWAIPNAKCPFLGSHRGGLVFTGLTLTPVQDAGRPLR
jgi:hypothetical protein